MVQFAGGYLRVSDVGGRKGDSYGSPEVQEEAVQAHAERLGFVIPDGWMILEEDVSGFKPARERRLEELVQACERGELQAIIVYHFDRFTREHPYEAPATLARLNACGAKLLDVVNGFDSSTPMGVQMAGMLASQAWGYRERVSETWRSSKQRAHDRGVCMNSTLNAGYLKIANGEPNAGTLIPGPKAHRIVEAYEMRLRGCTYREIAAFLDIHFQHEDGSHWTPGGARELIRNPIYTGTLTHGEMVTKNAHEAIVPLDLFNAVQGKRARPSTGKGKSSALCLLGGLLRCASCGMTLGVGASKNGRIYYHCKGQSTVKCNAKAFVYADQIDPFISDWLNAVLAADGPLATEVLDVNKRITEASDRLAQTERNLDELTALDYARSGITLASYLAMVKEAEGRLGMAEAEFMSAKSASTSDDIDTVQGWNSLTLEEKKQFLGRFLGRIVVTPARGQRGVPIKTRVQIIDRSNTVLYPPSFDNTTVIIEGEGQVLVETDDPEEVESLFMSSIGMTLALGRARYWLPDAAKDGLHDAHAASVRASHPGRVVKRKR